MTDTFLHDVQQAIVRDAPLDEIIAMLRRYRDAGLTSKAAYEALESIRSRAEDCTEDRILEVMDIVSGFCAPEMRVWGNRTDVDE